MNCLYSKEIRTQNIQNREVERRLQAYKRRYNKQIKLLLLGSRGSGKSTLIRQMRMFYDETFTVYDRRMYINTIHRNIFAAMKIIIKAMQKLQIPYETKENGLCNSLLIKYVDLNYTIHVNEVYLTALKELWADVGVQICYLRGCEYLLPDSAKYFFSHLDRIADPCYIPNDEDILRLHQPTKGFAEHLFKYRNVELHITEVGWQSSKRKKWLHCFDNVTSIIYLVATSEYDQFTHDPKRRNHLEESQELLKTIAQYDCFKDISIILAFNKSDLLEAKIMHSHLKNYFPEYNGPRYDPLAARNFILNMFLKVIPSNRRVYHYFTNSTDAKCENIIFIFTAVRDTILNSNLYYFNLI